MRLVLVWGGVAVGGVAGAGSGGAPVVANPNPPPRETSGCGCAVPGQSSERRALPLLLFALGVAGAGRRRFCAYFATNCTASMMT